MGLDVGKVRIGIALSDSLRLTAQPHSVLTRKNLDEDLSTIARLADREEVETIVIGWPRTLRGQSSESTQMAEAFAEALRGRLPNIPIELWDERLTSAQAEAMLLEADVRRSKRKQVADKIAAALILQSYLDRQRRE